MLSSISKPVVKTAASTIFNTVAIQASAIPNGITRFFTQLSFKNVGINLNAAVKFDNSHFALQKSLILVQSENRTFRKSAFGSSDYLERANDRGNPEEQLSHLTKVCDANPKLAEAHNELAELHLNFHDVAPDWEGPRYWGDIRWLNSAIIILTQNVRVNQDPRALEILEKTAARNPIYGYKALGDLYLYSRVPGFDGQPKLKEKYGIDYHLKAARAGNEDSAVTLYKLSHSSTPEPCEPVISCAKQAYLLLIKEIVSKGNPNSKSLNILRKCSQAGDVKAEVILAKFYAAGARQPDPKSND